MHERASRCASVRQRKQKRERNSVEQIDDKYEAETGDKIFKRRRNNLLKFISIHERKKL